MDRGQYSPRKIGPVLMLSIIVMPMIFAWVLWRKGYASSTRVAAFIYGGVTLTIGVIGRVGS